MIARYNEILTYFSIHYGLYPVVNTFFDGCMASSVDLTNGQLQCLLSEGAEEEYQHCANCSQPHEQSLSC